MSNKAKSSTLWHLINPVKTRINLAIFFSALSSILAVGALLSLVLLLQSLMTENSDYLLWMGLLGGLTVASFVSRLFSFHTSHLAAFRLEVILREKMVQHLAHLPLGYIQHKGSGALAKIMHADVKNLHGFVADTTPMYGKAYSMPLVTLILIFFIDWRLALAAMGVLLVGVGVMMLATKDYQTKQDQYMQESERVNSALVEFIQAMPVVRTFDTGTLSYSRLQKALDNFKHFLSQWLEMVGNSAAFSSIIFSPLPTLLAVCVVGVYLIGEGTTQIPNWVALLLLGSGLAEAVMPIMWMNMFVKKAESSSSRIQGLLDEPALVEPQESKQPQDASVSFKSVSFAYNSGEAEVLKNISFDLPEHSITALVGASGAGKTTIARLLPRFWDVSSGQICIGGVDVREMTQQALMQQVAFVFQDTFLFQTSIAENIAMGRPDATQQEVEDAAKAAYAHDFIMSLPNGYNSVAGERGTNLSGGQRQRITLARAILQDCPIIVLDEATAFADPESEAEIVKALGNLVKNKTILMVAHRLATIQNADQILVFDKGELMESGKHDDLLANSGRYAALWSHYQQAQNWNLTHPESAQNDDSKNGDFKSDHLKSKEVNHEI